MTRLANIEKAGYYPLPPTITDLILTYITPPLNGHLADGHSANGRLPNGHFDTAQHGRLLDPCAGEGTALVTLADKLGLEPFGVELHQERAEKAKTAVSTKLNTNGIPSKEDADAEIRTVATNGNGKRPPVPRPRLFIF